jgi:hypothetical protein
MKLINYFDANEFEHRRAVRRRNAQIRFGVFCLIVAGIAFNGAYWLLVWWLK